MKRTLPLPRDAFLWTASATLLALFTLGATLLPSVRVVVLAAAVLGVVAGLSARPLPSLLRLAFAGAAGLIVLWLHGVGGGMTLGRDVGSSGLAVMLGMKLSETRSLRDARSAVSFSLFAVMAAFLQDQGPLILSLAVVTVLGLFLALQHLAELDAGLRPAHFSPRVLVSGLKRSAWIALISLPLAFAGFFLFPRLASPLWGMPQNSPQARTGLSDSMSPGDISTLFNDDTPFLRVRFDGPMPAQSQLYWRGPVLTRFDGRRWDRGFFSGTPAPPLEGGAMLNYEIEQEPTDRHFLLALDWVEAAPRNTRMTRERSIVTERPLANVVRNRLSTRIDAAFEAALPVTLQRAYTELPGGFNPRTRELIQRWSQEADSATALIQRALQWFNAEFRYSLTAVPLLGRDTVDDFLFNTQVGYCEHFSSAFTVMMRIAGIPARVVTGYQGGSVNTVGGYLVVLQSDAHAWSEVWLPGQGWVRIDPTSAVAPERIERGSEALLPENAWTRAFRPLLDTADFLRRGWNDLVLGFNAERQSRLLQPFGIDSADWRDLGITLGAAALLALGLTLFWLLRSPSDMLPPVSRAWRRLLRRLRRRGHAPLVHEPPLSFARRVADSEPDLRELLVRATRLYCEWRYAERHETPQAQRAVITALDSLAVPRRRR